MTQLHPRDVPCPTCPYRQNCPSGVWDEAEYKKLPEYDRDTGEQPRGVFMCHDARDSQTMCRGWLDTHDKYHLLALRFAVMRGEVAASIFDLPGSGVPVFASGQEAAAHGTQDIEQPGDQALRVIDKLKRRT